MWPGMSPKWRLQCLNKQDQPSKYRLEVKILGLIVAGYLFQGECAPQVLNESYLGYLGIGAVILIARRCLCYPHYDGSGYVNLSINIINGVPSHRPKGPWWAKQPCGNEYATVSCGYPMAMLEWCPSQIATKGDPRALPDDASASAHVQDAGSTNLATASSDKTMMRSECRNLHQSQQLRFGSRFFALSKLRGGFLLKLGGLPG